tara:strand:+ start:132 stop:845 length:714 start_codon:yes stop_codon:yes gene_type:complete
MKTIKKIEVETLKLKLSTENLEIAESNLKEGTEDLHFRLSYFRKRVADKDIDKYDLQFFGGKLEDLQKEYDKQAEVILHQEKEQLPILHKKKDQWLKKIYRKIVTSTHPDKFVNFSVRSLKEKYLKIYRKTVLSWNSGDDDQVLLCAYETDIKVQNIKALPILCAGTDKKNKRLKEIQSFLAYKWYHIPEVERSKTLENYLKQSGYEFTIEEVEKVVHLARKRKVGTRPIKNKKIKK